MVVNSSSLSEVFHVVTPSRCGLDLGVLLVAGLDVDLDVLLTVGLDFDPLVDGVFRTRTILFVENRDGGVVALLLDNGVVDFLDLPPLGYKHREEHSVSLSMFQNESSYASIVEQ